MKATEYHWCLTIKQGNNLAFIACDAQDGNIVAMCSHRETKESFWAEGINEEEAVERLRDKVGIEKLDYALFEVAVFDENGCAKDIAPGPIHWTKKYGYCPDDRKLK